jgi:hypothetical protein
MWVERKARYPYTNPKTWWTRYHLLGRKIARQGGAATVHDRRVAAILVASAPQGSAADAALTSMEWITNGS